MALATAGGIVSGIGSALEVATNIVAGDEKDAAVSGSIYVLGETAAYALDKALPGPNPDMAPEIREIITAGKEYMKNKGANTTSDLAKKLGN